MEPAAISADPATTISQWFCTAPDRPAASAKGTVRPSDMPMTTSRTISDPVKCCSKCGAIRAMLQRLLDLVVSQCQRATGVGPWSVRFACS
jgi:hypothetical protein